MVIYEIRFVYYEFQHIFVVCITKLIYEIRCVYDGFQHISGGSRMHFRRVQDANVS